MRTIFALILLAFTPLVFAGHHEPGENVVVFTIDFTVAEGKAEQAREFTSRITPFVKETEPGTTGYGYYFTPDGSKCLLLEVYKDSDSALKHVNDFVNGDFQEEFFTYFVAWDFQILGPAKPDLLAALEGFTTDHRPLEQGFSRPQ